MPDRLIRESWCSSSKIDRLTPFEETVFARLIVNCDDFGRIDGRIAVLRSKLFVIRQRMSLARIEAALQHLQEVGLIQCYTAEGAPYVQLIGWGDHQRIRAQRSRYPAPPDIRLANTGVSKAYHPAPAKSNTKDTVPAGTCGQLPADACGCNEIQSNPNPNSNHKSNPIGQAPPEEEEEEEMCQDAFQIFWNAYPKKRNKEKAWSAFMEARGHLILDELLKAIDEQSKALDWGIESNRYVPAPENWLKDQRWKEVVTPPIPSTFSPRVKKNLSDICERIYSEAQLNARIPDPTTAYLEELS